MIHKIFYNKKVTSANTTYLQISDEDTQFLISKCIQIQSYMGELSLVKEKEVKDVYKWYTTSSKTLPYSNSMKRYNSPQSFISGTLNNLMFGTQREITETQSEHLQNIINNYQQLTDCITQDYKIKLQKEANTDSVMFVENLWRME
jgi:hypothetical protein